MTPWNRKTRESEVPVVYCRISPSAIIILLALLSCPFLHSLAKETKGTVTGNDVRIRTGPGKEFKVVGYANKGDSVTIYEEKGEWKRVKTAKGLRGWMHRDYIDTGEGDFFDEFFEHFMAALKAGNRDSLRRYMAEDLKYTFGPPEGKDPVSAAFKSWDETNAWPDIIKALSKGFVKRNSQGRTQYVSPPEFESDPEYYGWRAIFERRGGKWKCTVLIAGD
jgi:hypothetical protein